MTYANQYPTALCFVAILIFSGCSKDPVVAPELTPPDQVATAMDAAEASGRSNGTVSKPFKASFFTDLAGLAPDPNCGDPADNLFLNTQEGSGQATHLGRFSVHITFCVDASDLAPDDDTPGMLEEGESIPYYDGVGTLTAANGDELWITVAGEILPSDHPDFDFEFADPFEITGGTGRFDGASGGGTTDSLVDFQAEPSRTQHDWEGMLVQARGN